MGKALKTVGVIIGAAALIATGVGALAMPGLAGTTTLFGVSVGTLNTISSGLIAVGGMLDKPKSQGSATPDEWTSNPDQPIPFLMGRMGVAGKIVQRDEFGPDNMYQGIVGILSGAGPIRGVTSFAGDKQPVTFGANGIAVTSQWQGEMWMVRRSGAQPDTALAVPAGLKAGGSTFEWSSAARLSGKACYLQVLGENSKGTAFPAGIPDPVHVAEGIFGYDPRYDDTYPGGAGSCRLGVRSTYRWIEDGGIGGLNWALGLVENGQVVGGIGASIDGIDVPAFVEVANIADANGWKLAAWPDTSEDVSAVLDQLLQAAGAVRARHAGKISCVSRGAPRASVATITARDTAGDIELDTAPSLFNRLNTITPRFMSEAAGWVLTPTNPVSFAQYVTDDGGKHGDQIDYRFVPLLKQAAELAAYDILDAREPFSGTIPLKAHMRHLKRGDTFDIDEPGFLMDGVKCIVLSRSYDPKTAQVRIAFRSETDSKHALALGKTTTLPDFPTLTPTDPTLVSPPLPGDWTIIVRPPSPGGGQLPGFDLGGIVSNDTATAIIVEHGPSATGPWTQAYQGPPTVTKIPIDGLQPGASYYVAIQYQRNQNYSARQVYGPYTAPLLDPSPTAPTIAALNADLAALEALQASETVIREEQVNRLSTTTAAILDGQGGVRLDPTFNLWPAANARPDNVAAPSGLTISRQTTGVIYGDKAMRLVDPGTGNAFIPIVAAGFAPASETLHWVVEYQVTVNSGDLKRFGVQFRANRTTGNYGANVDLAAKHPATTTGATYRGSQLFTVAPLGGASGAPTTCQAWFYTNLSSFSGGAFSAKDLTLHRLQFRPATPEEIAAGSIPALEASVTQNSLAIVDLETGAALAKFELVAAASGGKPARFKLVSSSLGSAIALDAPWIYWGDNTVFDDATDTLQTTVGGRIRVMALGAPFGAASNLLEWWGPTGIALSAMTTGNGYNGRMTAAPYAFDNVSGAQFRVTSSHRTVAASRVGAGTVTTPLVTFEAFGATGPVTFDVYFVDGDGTITATNSSSSDASSPFQHQSAFTTTVVLGQVKGGRFACAVRDANGNTGSAFVNVGLLEST
jgi:hypothetical protein